MAVQHDEIRILVVDDSAFMRVALKKIIEEDGTIKVIAIARNGEEALDKIRKLKPDLVTLDIEMPVMDGLTVLETVMNEMPLPIIMISSLTEEGADATMKALDLGAVDFIPKGGKSYVNLDIVKIGEQLRQKIREIVRKGKIGKVLRYTRGGNAGQTFPAARHEAVHTIFPETSRPCDIVALGVSTGGPLALHKMIPMLPPDFGAAMVIVQHMPPTFTRSFANRLNQLARIEVREAEEGDIVTPGTILLAPGGKHMNFLHTAGGRLQVQLSLEPSDTLFRPSVDVMMLSLASVCRRRMLGVIMTGMGSDGLQGMQVIQEQGGVTLAQNEETCVVYGMPKACVESGVIDHVLPLEQLAEGIVHYTL